MAGASSDVFDQAADVFDQAADDPLVTGKGMEQNAQRQAASAVRGPLDKAAVSLRNDQSRVAPLGDQKPIQMAGAPPVDTAYSDYTHGKFAKPTADLLEAAGKAISPFAAPALVTATIPTLAAAGAGAAGSYLAKKGMEGAGGTPDQARLAGDVGGITAGSFGAEMAPEISAGDIANKVFRDPDTGKVSVTPWGIGHNVLERVVPKSPEPELGSPENPGFMAKLPTRMPKQSLPEPELGTPENPGWMAPLPNRMPVSTRGRTSITQPMSEGEGAIGSGPTERYVQTLMQKSILTPDEQASVERILGPNARMRPGEGLTDWRSRVTGKFKAARPRTE